jgi:sulfate adenylyltransferase subunit 1
VQRSGETDLALLTDGLSAEREQGITIDVAYRYFATPARKFIIGDAPGHEQYTRNMVTAASSADAAVVLVDATKLKWQNPGLELLPQTRRHTLLANLLRVPAIVFAVNKLDAVEDPTVAFTNIRGALGPSRGRRRPARAIVPISALKGHNVVEAKPGWCGYHGPSLLQLLEHLPCHPGRDRPRPSPSRCSGSRSSRPRRHLAGPPRVLGPRGHGRSVQPGQPVTVLPSGQTAVVAQVLDHARQPGEIRGAGHSAGIVLDREVDVSRGDWLLAPGRLQPSRELSRPRSPGWTTSRWWPAASTGRCTATAGSRPRSSASCTSWT